MKNKSQCAMVSYALCGRGRLSWLDVSFWIHINTSYHIYVPVLTLTGLLDL